LPVAESLNNLAGIHMDRGEFDQAAQQLEEALEIRTSILGAQHPLTLQTISNLANARWQLGQREEAHALVQQAADGYRALRADGAEGLGLLLSNLAAMQLAEGDPDAAERNLEEAARAAEQRGSAPIIPSWRSRSPGWRTSTSPAAARSRPGSSGRRCSRYVAPPRLR
jgi:tetratricopeptide (TPR) repeat protein